MYLQEWLYEIKIDAFQTVLDNYHISSEEQHFFHRFIQQLKTKQREENDGILVFQKREYDGVIDVRVYQEEQYYAIDFVPWETCLGYQVDESFRTYLTAEEMVFHTLYYMSFDGFDEKERQQNIDELINRIDNMKAKEEK